MSQPKGFADKVAFVWSVADLLRGDFKAHEYGQVILPFVVLRRLECALAPTKPKVVAKAAEIAGKFDNPEPLLLHAAGERFYNTSPLDLSGILQDPPNVAANLRTYIAGFSPGAFEVLDKYGLDDKITRLDKAGLLYQIIGKFAELDLSVQAVTNDTMGYIFEELLRRFSEMSNETAGEHFTPREVIRLMVNVLLAPDSKALAGQKPIRTIYDPACGTGGMLTVAQEHLATMNPNAELVAYGQELNPETWAICRSDLMIKGQDPNLVALGNSLIVGDDKHPGDGHAGERYDYLLANPPFGVDWNKYADWIRDEHTKLGTNGRYGPGLPRVSDGSMLFLLHMINKFKPVADDPETPDVTEGGSRMAIVLSGSPLFAGGAGSGESKIRRWIIENDLLEGIIALPDAMFYNTTINTYVWVLSNRKSPDREGRVVFVDARAMGAKMKKSLGDKRKELTEEAILEITRRFIEADSLNSTDVKVLPREALGYVQVTAERPLRRCWEVTEIGILVLPAHLRSLVAPLTGKVWLAEGDARAALEQSGVPVGDMREVLRSLTSTSLDAPAVVNGRQGVWVADSDLTLSEQLPLPPGYLAMREDQRREALVLLSEKSLAERVLPINADSRLADSGPIVGYEIHWPRLFRSTTTVADLLRIESELDRVSEELSGVGKSLAATRDLFANGAKAGPWRATALGRVCRMVNGGTPSPDPSNWAGGIPWATPVDLSSSGGFLSSTDRTISDVGLRTGSRLVPAGSVILSTRAPIGTVAITTVHAAFNQGCRGLIPSSDLLAECLAFQLLMLRQELESRGQGTTFMELKSSHLAAIQIFIPDLEWQNEHRVAMSSALEQFSRIRGLTEELIDLQRQHRRAVESQVSWEGATA